MRHGAVNIRQCSATKVIKMWARVLKVWVIHTVIKSKTALFPMSPQAFSMFHVSTYPCNLTYVPTDLAQLWKTVWVDLLMHVNECIKVQNPRCQRVRKSLKVHALDHIKCACPNA